MTLTTDFGVGGHHVGVMKGVILVRNPRARLVDLAHGVAAGAVEEAAWILQWSWRHFPAGTVHLAVVDPGVGGLRRALAARAGGHFFVGPDNGLLDPVLRDAGAPQVVALPVPPAGAVSATFHGRDLFAPAAGRLSLGEPPSRLGTPVRDWVSLALPRPRRQAPGVLRGEVVAVDRWGNLVTSITARDLEREGIRGGIAVRIGRRTLRGLGSHYAAVPPGAPVAVVNSNGHLEIAVYRGSAAETFAAGTGTPVTVRRDARVRG